MDSRTETVRRVSIAILCILAAASTFFRPCDARSHGRAFQGPIIQRISSNKPWKKPNSLNRLDNNSPLGSSNSYSYASPSSLPLPPYNSLAPQPTPSSSASPYPPFTPPRSAPPYPPFTPPSSAPPYPPLTPPSSASPYPPLTPPSIPGTGGNPSLPAYSPIPNPPHYAPSPPSRTHSPPKHAPNPPKSVPSPPLVYLPPLVYPPPPASSPTHKKPQHANWCVAKPTVPDPIIQEAMDYACGSGADCKSIQPNGSCYQPNTLLAHASYAFNSYWQNTKVGGGTCDFGGTAMLVTVDPSYYKCHFMLI